MILGCTHYPLIKENVDEFYKGSVKVLDSSEIVAASLKAYLEYNLLNNQEGKADYKFLVSDYTPDFEKLTKQFFGEEVKLEKYPLWE